jgi:hypothetical protein
MINRRGQELKRRSRDFDWLCKEIALALRKANELTAIMLDGSTADLADHRHEFHSTAVMLAGLQVYVEKMAQATEGRSRLLAQLAYEEAKMRIAESAAEIAEGKCEPSADSIGQSRKALENAARWSHALPNDRLHRLVLRFVEPIKNMLGLMLGQKPDPWKAEMKSKIQNLMDLIDDLQ